MNDLILIGAVGKNNEIGKNNKLIWYIPEDLKFFRNKTINHTVVMGYNTFISLPKLLYKRKHIVLTHKDIVFPKDVIVCHNKEELFNKVYGIDDDIFIIGGFSLYNMFINDCNKMYLTEINETCNEADTFFPIFNKEEWDRKIISNNRFNDIKYKHVFYKKK